MISTILVFGVLLVLLVVLIANRKKDRLPWTKASRTAEIDTGVIEPGSVAAFNNLANSLKAAGRWEEAESAFRQALAIESNHAVTHNNLGVLYRETNRPDAAKASFCAALAIRPDFPEALKNLGFLLMDTGSLQDAVTAFRQALAMQANDIDTLTVLADALTEVPQLAEAEATYLQALELKPGHLAALIHLGNLYKQTHRIGEAELAYRRALNIQADIPVALSNLGALLVSTGRLLEAEGAYRQALKVAPGFADALQNLALLNLLKGRFEAGWQGMEHRWQARQKQDIRVFSRPRWDGKAYFGKTLLVYYEQGVGDNIQLFRYLPELAAMGSHLAVECPTALFRLFRANLPPDVQLVRYQDALPDFDLYCPSISLPLYFNTRLESIPAKVPYLRPPVEAVANCPVLSARTGARYKVGIVWAGNPIHPNDYIRSLDFSLLKPLFVIIGITWVILQKERRPEGFDLLVKQNGWLDPMPEVNDFADTAAIIGQLDLVIGVDTSVIHLAGALGKPVWLLLQLTPDWRWLLQREDSPWYPGMRLFRQTAYNDWPGVIQRVATALPAECDAILQANSTMARDI